MLNAYLKAHVFVCPSSIENSPNSLGEAQILGVPSIGSYVGGSPDMIAHNESGLLYRFEEYEMLAYHIMDIFNNDEKAKHLSKNSSIEASKRHDKKVNSERLIAIYKTILNL